MTSTASLDTAGLLLGALRDARAREVRASAQQLALAAGWADLHPAESIMDAAVNADSPVPIAGAGAPLVAEFCLAEFAAALGVSTDAGRALVADALDLRHRLPRLWARVHTHTERNALPAWRARRIAAATRDLTVEAAGFVDRHLAPVAHRTGLAQLDRAIDTAVARFMPGHARHQHQAAADRRHFDVDHRQVSFAGTSRITGEIDLADALDLDKAVARRAAQLATLGSPDTRDGRRATAIGEIARHDLTLDLDTDLTDADTDNTDEAVAGQQTEPATPATPATPGTQTKPVKQVKHGTQRDLTLYVHLTGTPDAPIGYVENTQRLVTAEQIKAWCASPFTQVTVKPVLDLDAHYLSPGTTVPARLAEQTALRDHTCVFPWCTRPARRCDTDHTVASRAGGTTCSCNLAALCRRHHRLKTHHGGWTYTTIEPGTYLWTSPHGYQFLRDPGGTSDVSRAGPPPPPG